MNIIFFGTSEFAIPSLQAIAKSRHKILAVVTRPDKKGGRGLHLLASPVKMSAMQLDLEIKQPENLLSEDTIKLLKQKNADIFIVISYGQILPKEILNIPKKYCINLHASLLPKYRGAAPCNWAVINGEEKTGVTIMRLSEKLDAGDIIASQAIDISGNDTSFDIYKELSFIGAETLLACLDLIESKKETFTKQNEKLISYAPKLKKEDGLISWSKEAKIIQNLIRGTQPWPGAYTYLDGKLLKIYKAQTEGENAGYSPGEISGVFKDYFTVSCGKGALRILHVQLEGKKQMPAEEFLRGVHLQAHKRLE